MAAGAPRRVAGGIAPGNRIQRSRRPLRSQTPARRRHVGVGDGRGLVPVAALAAEIPTLLAPGPRSRAWADLLLDEDPTSPDVLEIAAVIDGLAGRIGGAERKLTDLIYFSADRYLGLVRAATVWQRVGQGRLACVAWLRAARWRDEVDDPAWRQAMDCTRGDPGAGDWRAIRQYVLDRAPADRRERPWKAAGRRMSLRHLRSWQGATRANTPRI